MAICDTDVGYNIPMSVIVALILDYQFGTARFLCVKHKASSNAFTCIGLTRQLRLVASASGIKTGTKIRFFFEL